ncbi:MAG TPA: hypothetical protein DCL54_02525 [Alphaproteobacteria bacterium]|nr:hypothetical protein [Alphaproteobacteria bacterium]HAJ45441.1 hypothetical protein [Alphaproteobacteria bacterium]
MRLIHIAAGAAIILGAAFASNLLWRPEPSHANGEHRMARTISVNGEGEAYGRPDQASISTGVTSEAATAQAALSANTAQMTQVIAELKKAGIEDKDIQTSNFSVSPVYENEQPGIPRRPKISSYRVSNSVSILVRDLSKMGAILDQVVQLGSNEVGGINFSIKDTKALMTEAREAAIADAKARAETYAKAAGVSVGRVLSISEGGAQAPVPMFAARAVALESAPVPIEAGQQQVSATVSVVFELN